MTKCNFPITCPSDISKGFSDSKQIVNHNMIIIVFYSRVAISLLTRNSMMGEQYDFFFHFIMYTCMYLACMYVNVS